MDFSDSTEVIRKTAKSIDTQMREVVSEIAGDLKENGSNLANRAMAPVREAYTKVTDTINLENLTEATKTANDYTLKTTEEIIDGVMVNSEKWQGVAEKAIKGGLKMAAKQQDMVFGTVETLKGQLANSSKRLKKLIYNKPARTSVKKENIQDA